MSETTQTYLGLESTRTPTNPGFQSVLNYIRERATSEYRKGELFERLMLTYLTEDPDYKEQFSEVYLYKQWASDRTDFDANDIGIDLVAKERHGGYCAIQCKCYAEDTRIAKPALDSFISASASELFTSRLMWIPAANGDQTHSEPLIQSEINSESFATATLKAAHLTGPT